MFQELKKKYLVKHLVISIFMFVIGMVFLAIKIGDIKVLLAPKKNLDELMVDEITTPMRVDADIEILYDYYTYSTKNSKVEEKEYFIPVGEEEYMGVAMNGSDISIADDNMNATWDYMDGDIDALDRIETIHVTGTILPLTGEEAMYYNQYIDELEWTEEEKELFLPYVLKVGYIGESNKGEFVIMLVIAAVCFVIGIIWLIWGLKGNYMKNIRKYCEASGNPEVMKERLERFYEMTPEVCGIRISPEFYLSAKGNRAIFGETKSIIWAYQHVVKHSVNLIPVCKTYSIILANADGSRTEVVMKNKKKSEAALEHIANVLPYLFVGYDDQLNNAFNQNRQAMIETVAERRNGIYQEQTLDNPTYN